MAKLSERAEKGKSPNKPPLYVLLPSKVVQRPPHRHDQNAAGVEPFALAVGCAAVALAKQTTAEPNFQHAFAAGGAGIKRQKVYNDTWDRDWKATKRVWRRNKAVEHLPQRHHVYKGPETRLRDTIPETYGKAGKHAFQLGLRQARKYRKAKDTEVTLSRYALLRSARLSDGINNRNKLETALNRLTKPVGQHPPMLVGWEEDASGALHIVVAAWWLKKPFRKVPLPLPMRATALALYLLLHWFDTSPMASLRISPNRLPERKPAISIASLRAKLGFPQHCYNSWAKRKLDQALDHVNQHLARLDHAALQRAKLKPIARYSYKIAGPNILFLGDPWQEPNYDDLPGMSEEAWDEKSRRAEQAAERKVALADKFKVREKQPDQDTTSSGKRFEDLSSEELDQLPHEDWKAWLKWDDRRRTERKKVQEQERVGR
jgi:hypothetical protein